MLLIDWIAIELQIAFQLYQLMELGSIQDGSIFKITFFCGLTIDLPEFFSVECYCYELKFKQTCVRIFFGNENITNFMVSLFTRIYTIQQLLFMRILMGLIKTKFYLV